MEYCRRCRRFGELNFPGRQKYCLSCRNKVANGADFNRYRDFKSMSFEDCYDEECWGGFSDIKYSEDLLGLISHRFRDIEYVTSFYHTNRETIDSNKIVYLVSDSEDTLLKVGQTVNTKTRFAAYFDLSSNQPLRYDIFVARTWDEQDLYEHKVRNYLEYLGFLLPEDNSGQRLKYIQRETINV